MRFPLQPADVKIVQGSSGKGLQVECPCGAVNWNHLEIRESPWSCRNCGQVFTEYFPGLVQKVLAQQRAAEVPEPAAPLAPRGLSMSELANKHCVPCRGGVPPLTGNALESLQAQVQGWSVVDAHHLTKDYKFPDFRKALEFVNRVGALAEEQGHHPDLFLAWGKVGVKTWTHAIDGLTESDFILAAKIDQLHKPS